MTTTHAAQRTAEARLLVVEDDPNIVELLSASLRFAGFEVATAHDGHQALRTAREFRPDLMVLDVMMPGIDGFEVVRRLGAEGSRCPVVFLTARDAVADKIMGLTVGGDDYVTKPFCLEVLTARIRAVLRRIRPGLAEDRVRHGDIVIDRVAHRVKRSGREVHLGPTEFRLLDYLMQHPGRVFSREQLLDAVWGSDVYVEARTVDVHIGRLRKALGADEAGDPIRTVRSAGYSLDMED